MHAEQPLRQARADLERRLRAGEERPAEAVLAANPALAADAEVALELIYAEFALREALGQQPDPAGWCSRFPQWRERLHRLFQVDAALRLPPGLLTATDREAVLGRTLQELLRRWQQGETVRLEDYLSRYPHWADSLSDLFAAAGTLYGLGVVGRAGTPPPAPVVTTADALVDALGECRLLTTPQLEELRHDLRPRFPDPRGLARQLMERRWLTPYQLNQLFRGRSEERRC